MDGLEKLTGMNAGRKSKVVSFTVVDNDNFKKDLEALVVGTNGKPTCRNVSRAIEFSVRLTAERIRHGLDLRPLM